MKIFLILIIAGLAISATACNKQTAYGRTLKDTGVLIRDTVYPPPPPPPPAANPYPANLAGFIRFMNDHSSKRWGVNYDYTPSKVYFGWICSININGQAIHQQGVWYWVPTDGFIPTRFPYIHQNLKNTATPGSSPTRSVMIGTNVRECPYFYEAIGTVDLTATAGNRVFRWNNVPILIQQNWGTEKLPFAGKEPKRIDIFIY